MGLDIRQLRLLRAVGDTGSIGRAAALLHLTQPPLTRQLAALERQLGLPLIRSSRTGTTLTPAGRALADAAPGIQRALDAALDAARRAAVEDAGAVHFGYAANMALGIATDLTRAAAHLSPPITLVPHELNREDQLARLRAGRLDLALLWGPVHEPDLRSLVVGTHRMTVLLADTHPMAGRAAVALEELAGERWINNRNAGGLDRRSQLARQCRAAGFTPVLAPPVGTLADMVALVAAGRGIGVGPSPLGTLHPPQIVAVPVDDWMVDLVAVVRQSADGRLPRVLTLLDRDRSDAPGSDFPSTRR